MAAPALQVVAVPVLADNYAWLVFDPATEEAAVVDPGEAAPVLAAARSRGWTISQVWTTHWHPDHTGGNAAMKAAGATIIGPEAERARIDPLDTGIREGSVVRIGAHTGKVMAVPGHTAGHIALHFAEDALLFTGDTLFAMGCGRLFEGTPEQMWVNMERFAALPDETLVFGGHEYTRDNARFAASVEPDNAAIAARRAEVDALRARDLPTLPTTIGQERATNPFLRAGSARRLGELRAAKDGFRG